MAQARVSTRVDDCGHFAIEAHRALAVLAARQLRWGEHGGHGGLTGAVGAVTRDDSAAEEDWLTLKAIAESLPSWEPLRDPDGDVVAGLDSRVPGRVLCTVSPVAASGRGGGGGALGTHGS